MIQVQDGDVRALLQGQAYGVGRGGGLGGDGEVVLQLQQRGQRAPDQNRAAAFLAPTGDLRVPHFIGLHSIQGFVLTALVLAALAARVGRLRGERVRAQLAGVVIFGYGALFAITAWQALRGQSALRAEAARRSERVRRSRAARRDERVHGGDAPPAGTLQIHALIGARGRHGSGRGQ
ncbi:hypothetical protein H4W80_006523 [Nonomuraea angiospora]|uniref:Uncharacterized protein n=1 Tax=Nonomuraea angiospora TaxID=46172 RepID=A0ABR9M6P1_9ACTN|nr:hypothetical protein [Nonomuraea angiospora]